MLLNGTVEDRLHSTQFRIEELKFVWRVDKQISHFSFWNVEFMSDHCRYFDQSVLYSYLLNFSSTKIIHFWVPWMESTVMNCVLVIFFPHKHVQFSSFQLSYIWLSLQILRTLFFFFFFSEFIKNLFTYLFLFFISSKNKMPKSFFVFFLYIFSSFQICWCVYNAYIWNIFLISLLSLWLYFSSVQ